MSKNQVNGMAGVYLVAAELSLRGYVVSLTVRNTEGADLLLTDTVCSRSYSIQVKTNKSNLRFWLMSPSSLRLRSRSLFYVLVNLCKDGTEFFVVPSKVVAEGIRISKASKTRKRTSYSIYRDDIAKHQDNWRVFKLTSCV